MVLITENLAVLWIGITDPTFDLDAYPDSDPVPDPTRSFTHVGKSEDNCFTFIHSIVSLL